MFLALLDIVIDARLIFVGSSINLSDYSIPENKYNNFKVVDWTDIPEKYIEESDILLDYNANIENDVFISSKLTKYIGYNRKILVLSGDNSAPKQFIADQHNLGIWNSGFSTDDFVCKALEALQTDFSKWNKRIEFCKSKNASVQIRELIDLV
jgi:hypothetical protein